MTSRPTDPQGASATPATRGDGEPATEARRAPAASPRPEPRITHPTRKRQDPRRALGAEGEDRAARYLARRGYRIVERNVRAGGVEVDLIAQRGRCVIFVEVKTRRSRRHGAPELAVDSAKQARLVRAATAWLSGQRARFHSARFDVIACTAPDGPAAEWQIDHLPGAFEANG